MRTESAGLAAAIAISEGDMRTALNIAQAVAASGDALTEDAVYRVCAARARHARTCCLGGTANSSACARARS